MKISKAHIIGDVGVALTRLRCGQMELLFREKPTLDYGLDAEIEIIDGENATGRLIGIQIKCGHSYFSEADEESFIFRCESSHLEYWDKHALPVIVVLANHESEVCYWAPASKVTAKSTGTGYKIRVPKTNVLSASSRQTIIGLAKPLIASAAYERILEQDLSSGSQRALTHYIVLKSHDKPWTKDTVAQVILQETAAARSSGYFRNVQTKMAHEGSEPQVVRVFVYHSMHEKDLGDYVAKATWISESESEINDLPPRSCRGLTIEWNEKYSDISKAINELRSSKQEYIDFHLRKLQILKHLVFKYYEILKYQHGLERRHWIEFDADATAILQGYSIKPIPPIECAEFNKRLDETIALLANARILIKRLIPKHDGRAEHQVNEYIEQACETVKLASYEFDKLTR